MAVHNQPWWLSGLERESNLSRRSLEAPDQIPLGDGILWYHSH